jgi:hypothetical protein
MSIQEVAGLPFPRRLPRLSVITVAVTVHDGSLIVIKRAVTVDRRPKAVKTDAGAVVTYAAPINDVQRALLALALVQVLV